MDDPSAIAQSKVPRMTRPYLASRPFHIVEGPDWVGPALADDILNEVVRRGRFSALSRHTTFGLKQEQIAVLGADAIISGTVRDNRLEIQLSGLEPDPMCTGYSGFRVERLQPIADDVADWLLDILGGPLDLPPGEAPDRRETAAPAAHAACLRALEALWTFSETGNSTALENVRALCASHPNDALANALRACLATRGFRSGWIADRDSVVAEVEAALNAAYANWHNNPHLLWTTGFAEAMLFRRYPKAATLSRRAHIELPHQSPALTWGSLFLSYDLDFDGALSLARQSMRVSPNDPMRVTQGFAGALASFHGARFVEALELCEMVLDTRPQMINVLRIKSAALAHMGELEEAREVMAKLLGIACNETRALIAQVNPLREWPGFQRFLCGLEQAGMP